MSTFTVRGAKIRTASARRFIVVECRPADFPGKRWDPRAGAYVDETYRAFPPRVIRRSDDYATALKAKGKNGHPAGGWCVVIDTATGEEV